MHCDCCDKLLDNEEGTARFFDEDKNAEPRYVGMCRECRSFLPPSVRIITRKDFENEQDEQPEFYFEDEDDGYEE